ncbi:SDR family NAD(P)-dependent oxidoreductase [Spirillospora sp. NPDC048911]|uniref:SDR family NAD(P)-dependent oxidoreductase n=1 Tax=Spirillospora sp. NPDC048911 TaxID=3364527 RepID=UPI0037228E64
MSGTAAPRAVVTGAARGIGRAILLRLIQDGYQVTAVDRDGPALERACAGSDALPFVGDVTDPMAVTRLAERVGECRALVNNAGIWRYGPLADVRPEQAREVIDTNLLAPLLLMQAFVPTMTEGACVVNLSSVTAHTPTPKVGIYPASKAALETLTRQAAVEFGPLGIRCNAVGPGLIHTEGTASDFGDAAVVQRRGGALPLGRLGVPGDIAGVVAFLCSDDARYITGQVLYADGGYTAVGGTGSTRWKDG